MHSGNNLSRLHRADSRSVRVPVGGRSEFVAVTDGGRGITWQDSSGNSGPDRCPAGCCHRFKMAPAASFTGPSHLFWRFAGDIVECLTQAAAIASASCSPGRPFPRLLPRTLGGVSAMTIRTLISVALLAGIFAGLTGCG